MADWWLVPDGDDTIRARIAAVRRDVRGSLELARDLGAGAAGTADGLLRRWDLLARAASVDLTATRAIEPHLDALEILAQAGIEPPPEATFGVYAAEGPGGRLTAREDGHGWVLTGTKPWCSLAAEVSHCLVTAWVDEDRRGLFLVDLGHDGVRVEESTWVPSGLSLIRSGPVGFDDVPAVPVGEPQWYLNRPGFAWGGIGVAAIWYGAAVGLAQRLLESARARTPDDIALMHLGACDTALASARAVLRDAAATITAGAVDPGREWAFAVRARDVCALTAEGVLRRADHAMGPGPLTSDEEHARRVDDLRVYVRQHHAERDQLTLGRALLDG